MTCAICHCPTGVRHTAREMMFGTRDEFTYFECGDCGCLQLATPPADMGRYYPEHYYSLGADPAPEIPVRPGGLRGWVAENRNAARVFGRGGFWGLVAALRPRPDVRPLPPAVRDIPGLSFRSRVLDVGCGSGELLVLMDGSGFHDLTGADPFRSADARPTPRVRLLRRTIEAVDDGPYDAIMFHHSLEHIPDQQSALTAARRLLAPDGVCLVRIPTVSSAVWREYGTDWVELDAPRHYFLHSHDSLRRLAAQCGLTVRSIACDAGAFGYYGSELYRRDVPLRDAATGAYADVGAHLGPADLAAFEERAAADNARADGGRLVAYLTPAGRPVPARGTADRQLTEAHR